VSERATIIVIGAGPCGLAVGVAARAAGFSCVLLDKGPVVSAIERYPLDMTFFSTPDHLELGGVPFVSIADKPSRAEALNYYRRIVRHFDLDVRQYEEVTAAGRAGDGFTVRTRRHRGGDGEYRSDALVVATGYFDTPNRLGVPGEQMPKVSHYFREPHLYFDQDVVVVGAGNSAIDAALSTWRAGARVTLVHRFEDFDPGVKPWVLPDIRNRVKAGEISVRWESRILAIETDRVRIGPATARPDGGGDPAPSPESGPGEWIPNDFVLAMTGFRPDPGLLLSLGAPVDPNSGVPEHDADTMETPVPGLFIAGVLAAGFDANRIFIQNGREHGGRIVRSLRMRFIDGVLQPE
jgi:thioredoxin reductase (NADPH)